MGFSIVAAAEVGITTVGRGESLRAGRRARQQTTRRRQDDRAAPARPVRDRHCSGRGAHSWRGCHHADDDRVWLTDYRWIG